MATVVRQDRNEGKTALRGIGIQQKKTRRWLAPLIILLVLAAGGAAYYYYYLTQRQLAAAQTMTETLQTAKVRTGSITLSVSGSGTLVAGQEKALAFSTAGTVGEVNAAVGDVVKAGQQLAKLADVSELEEAVQTAKDDLLDAQQNLESLRQSADTNIAAAQLSLAEAQKALADAKSAVVQEGWTRCDQEKIDAYYYQYTHAKDALEALGDGGGSASYYLTQIVPAKNKVDSAYAAYIYCAGFTEYEIASSQASVTLAEADLKQAQEELAQLQENGGVDPLELAQAENTISKAELALRQAQEKLDGAAITAPFDGTILSVAGSAGDEAGTGGFITIADLAHPQVNFSVDETDFSKVFIGENAAVTFDAYPDLVFPGKVVRVDPALTTSGGYQVATGVIELDMNSLQEPVTLPKGLNGTVQLVEASAEEVLIVPVQAVRDLGDGAYGVFVVDENGKPRLRIVEAGLMDLASAEIKSGVELGDTVTTGTTETNQSEGN